MRYTLLIYGDPAAAPEFASPEGQAELAAWQAYTQAMLDAGVHSGGAALQPTQTATTVRVRDGETLTLDGPFAETKEILGGFSLLDVDDLDAAGVGGQGAEPLLRLGRAPAGHDVRLSEVTAAAALERAVREDGPGVLATLIRHLDGDFALAEDALQDAYLSALTAWERRVPDVPAAWLTTAARRKALDRLRRARGEDERVRAIEALAQRTGTASAPGADEGIDKIAAAGIPYRVPPDELLPERTAGVLATLYVIFTEGHTASRGAHLGRPDLAAEAIRLARLLAEIMPDDAEALGLLALMLLTEARQPARTDAAGASVGPFEQDRTRWDAAAIDEGTALIDRALRLRRPGPYQLQAAVAALHARAPSFEGTDWPQIAALYAALHRRTPTPVVAINRAVAVGFADGPAAGLALLDAVAAERDLVAYVPLHAARADLLRRAGDLTAADAAYAAAITASQNAAQRADLQRRRAAAARGRP